MLRGTAVLLPWGSWVPGASRWLHHLIAIFVACEMREGVWDCSSQWHWRDGIDVPLEPNMDFAQYVPKKSNECK